MKTKIYISRKGDLYGVLRRKEKSGEVFRVHVRKNTTVTSGFKASRNTGAEWRDSYEEAASDLAAIAGKAKLIPLTWSSHDLADLEREMRKHDD